MRVTLRHFGVKSSGFCFGKCGSIIRMRRHANGEVHSGMSAGRAIGKVRKEGKAMRFSYLRKRCRFGEGARQVPVLSPALYTPGDRHLLLGLASLIFPGLQCHTSFSASQVSMTSSVVSSPSTERVLSYTSAIKRESTISGWSGPLQTRCCLTARSCQSLRHISLG